MSKAIHSTEVDSMNWDQYFRLQMANFQQLTPRLSSDITLYIGTLEKRMLLDHTKDIPMVKNKDPQWKCPDDCNAMYAGVKIIYTELLTHFKFVS